MNPDLKISIDKSFIGLGIIFIIGFGNLFFHINHVLIEDSFAVIIYGVSIPILLSISMILSGIYLIMTNIDKETIFIISIWSLSGFIILCISGFSIVLYQEIGDPLTNELHIILNNGIYGANIGAIAGLYHTQKRKVRKKLERYKKIIENLPVGIYRNKSEKNRELIEINQELINILGGNSKKELIKYSLSDFCIDEKRRKKLHRKLDKKGKIENEKLKMKTLDEKEIWTSITTMKTEENNHIYHDGILFDITEKKWQEEKLKETKQRLEEAQHVADIGHWTWNIETNNLEWSDQVYRIFGLKPDEFDPTYPKFLEYVHPEDREKVEKNVEEALEKNNYDIDHRIIQPTGKTRIVREIGEVYYENDNPKRMLGTVQDVTEKQKQKRELETFKKAVEQSGHAIYITDRDGTIEYVNSKFERQTGYDEKEAIGKNPRILKSGEHEMDFYEKLWDTILSGKIWESEITNRKKNGELYHVNQTIAPIYYQGEIERFVAVNKDITEIKKQQKRLNILTRVLRHDILNNMNIILSNTEYLKKQITRNKYQDFLDVIIKNIEKTVDISKNSRKIQKLIEKEGIQRKPIDIVKIIKERVEILDDSYPSAQISVDLPESAKATTIKFFDSVIDNALENAIEHNDKDTPRVCIYVEKCERYVVIKVSDNGSGLREEQTKVLERGTETDLEHLEGLGLWIMNWVVNESGGEIKFSQKRDNGSIVIIRLKKPGYNQKILSKRSENKS